MLPLPLASPYASLSSKLAFDSTNLSAGIKLLLCKLPMRQGVNSSSIGQAKRKIWCPSCWSGIFSPSMLTSWWPSTQSSCKLRSCCSKLLRLSKGLSTSAITKQAGKLKPIVTSSTVLVPKMLTVLPSARLSSRSVLWRAKLNMISEAPWCLWKFGTGIDHDLIHVSFLLLLFHS